MELKFRSFLSNESGATAIEYGVLAALIATAISFIFGDSGIFINALNDKFDEAHQIIRSCGTDKPGVSCFTVEK
ncbi:Flp family type IVb pilin [Pectobacterium carotovorum]|uniref:Flp family type IVb pilin n=1 Tax=Pectobacterium carotovorum TaxID=554 RepID=UPI000E7719BF|nr:Flp family type IVb pilin [Pectobacterium carotovorum]RJL49010.1 Flp family type IVb pilin [Pectobacterium carotovorum]